MHTPVRRWSRGLLCCAALLLLGVAAGRLLAQGAVQQVHPAGYVGAKACAQCHAAEAEAWAGSHHASSMQTASAATVEGHFDGASITVQGVTSTFFRRDGEFWVRTEGHDVPIAYTFGVYPLQQYLTPLAGGRLQALTLAWDARPLAQGGQRWFSLYPGEHIGPDDPLHWTARNFNWNGSCAECHSTAVVRGYQSATDSWRTRVSDLDVGCEACHGPGQNHLAWAHGLALPGHGFAVSLGNTSGGHWGAEDARGIRQWQGPRRDDTQLDQCAPCHARRHVLSDGPHVGTNEHALSLLDDGLYFPDGQIRDEVFEAGSFLQSKMYGAGVTCADCHDPHSAKLRAPGNDTCAACHAPERFDTPAHTHHVTATPAAPSPASQCVTCHMPTRTYMGVHERHDHSIRLPAPALAARIGSPDPCLGCHKDRSPAALAASIAAWTGKPSAARIRAPRAIAAAFRGEEGANEALAAVAEDAHTAPITRATALSLMNGGSVAAIRVGVRDKDPLPRMGAARAIANLAVPERAALAGPLLGDPLRRVRIEAARALAGVADADLPPPLRISRARAEAEWIAAQEASAQWPETHANLAGFWADKGDAVKAEEELRTALRLEPNFVPGLINLADLYRATGRDALARLLLEQAVEIAPPNADALYAYGLLLVRQGDKAGGSAALARAAQLRPQDAEIARAAALLAKGGAR